MKSIGMEMSTGFLGLGEPLRVDPRNVWADLSKGMSWWQAENSAKAIEDATQTMAMNPNSPDHWSSKNFAVSPIPKRETSRCPCLTFTTCLRIVQKLWRPRRNPTPHKKAPA
jgi:hypothetical protein